MKTCIDCSKQKPYQDFVLKVSCKDGYEPRCRSCRTIKYNKSTPELLCKKLYNSQIFNSIKRGHTLPDYTLDQLIEVVLTMPGFHKLYKAWKDSGYSKNLVPSIDRKSDALPYTISNLQLMTWEENRAKSYQSKKDNELVVNQRAVNAFTKEGALYKTYSSMSEAMRDLGGVGSQSFGISSVCNGIPVPDGKGKLYTPRTYKGFIWKWAN